MSVPHGLRPRKISLFADVMLWRMDENGDCVLIEQGPVFPVAKKGRIFRRHQHIRHIEVVQWKIAKDDGRVNEHVRPTKGLQRDAQFVG